MNKNVFVSFTILLLVCKVLTAQNFISQTIEYDGNNREYELYIPSSYSQDVLSPLMLNFHGGNGTSEGQIAISDMRNLADENNFILGPTPNSNYAIELHYFYRPASLTAGADSGTTWVSTNAPFALLYGALVEAYTFMKGETDVIQNYNGLYTQYLERLKDLGEARENTDGYRVGLPSRPRT